MPIEGLQANGPAPVSATSAIGQAPANLPNGTLEGRVAAVLEDGTVRFTTAFGSVDLTTDQPLQVGTRAQLLVENTGIRILLTQLAASDARAAGAPVEAASAARPPLAAPPVIQPAADPAGAERAAASVLGAAARAATATQQNPAALLSRLLPLLSDAAGALPPEVQRAAAQVAALPLRPDVPLDGLALQAALRQSGLFREARSASAAPRGPDWKQALIGLRDALQAWSPPPPPEPEAGAEQAASAPPPAGGAAPSPDDGAPAPDRILAPSLSAETDTRETRAPSTGVAGRPAAPAGQALSETEIFAALSEEAPNQRLAATPHLLGSLVAKAFGGNAAEGPAQPRVAAPANPGDAAPSPPEHRLAPPRADQPPRPLEPRPADPSLVTASPQDQRDSLLALAEGALDRVRLSQYASLPREAAAPQQPAQPGQPHAPAWVFDVPFVWGQEASVAQFRVTRDGRGATAEGARPSWSVDVAIDTGETGPVHARVRLGGEGLGVTLWAERPETAETLRQDMPALRRSLDEAAFTVEDVAILTGAPAATPPAQTSGYFLDQRS